MRPQATAFQCRHTRAHKVCELHFTSGQLQRQHLFKASTRSNIRPRNSVWHPDNIECPRDLFPGYHAKTHTAKEMHGQANTTHTRRARKSPSDHYSVPAHQAPQMASELFSTFGKLQEPEQRVFTTHSKPHRASSPMHVWPTNDA